MATTKQDFVRSKLQTKVFDVIGKSVTLKSAGTPTYNDRGEAILSPYTESTVTVVPYNILTHKETFEGFGEVSEGDMDMAVPYDVIVAKKDIFTIESVDYEVRQIEQNFLPDNVVSIIRVSKVQP